jgi:DNA-binding NarL/FixJ family response regulator
MTQHTVAIVAASPLVGEGLTSALADDPSLRLVAIVRHAADVDGDAGAPGVVVAAATDARDALSLHHALGGRVPLVLLGDAPPPHHAGPGDAPLALLPTMASPGQLRAAVQAVLAGLHAWSPELGADAAPRAPMGNAHEPPGEPLTPRELEVFELVAKGLSNRDIAAALGISSHTAKFHVGQILAKIGAATRAEAVLVGLKLGLIGV